MNIEKKKTKKQKGGLINNYRDFSESFRNENSNNKSLSPLATIFRFRRPNKNLKNFITNTSNRLLREPKRIAFIKEIKELLLSQVYQQNIPVFYGNQSKNYKNNGYNEYVCKTILGRLGVISSKRRIFIINPFAEFVYRITFFCIANNYKNKIDELQKLLKKLLKLDDKFNGFPEIVYLPYGLRFCIVKDKYGIEKVITSQEPNISSCSLVSGCSLMISAEIREENLPSEKDIIELYDILGIDYKLWEFYNLSKYPNKENKLLKYDYFTNILSLFGYLDELQNLFIQSKQNNDYIEIKIKYRDAIINLYHEIVKNIKSFSTLKQYIDLLINQQYSKKTLKYSILLILVEFVINQLKTNKNVFDGFLLMFEKLKKKYELSENKYFEGILQLFLLLNDLIQAKITFISIIKNNDSKKYILKLLLEIYNLNSDIPELQKIFMTVKYCLLQEGVSIFVVSKQLLKIIVDLLRYNNITHNNFVLFLKKKPYYSQQIFRILHNYSNTRLQNNNN